MYAWLNLLTLLVGLKKYVKCHQLLLCMATFEMLKACIYKLLQLIFLQLKLSTNLNLICWGFFAINNNLLMDIENL